MKYLYETHCHTAAISACSSLSAEDIVALYTANGYDGVFITDHFLNGNTTVNRNFPTAPYKEKIERFCTGYEEVKRAAAGRLRVFFGFEYSYLGTDVLVYGWNGERLAALPQIMDMDMRSFILFCKENGALAVQAHPFREDFYIDHIRLYPDAEGVEVFNAGRTQLCNSLGEFYGRSYDKILTSGSDLHSVRQPVLGGMEFDEPVLNEEHFISLLRSGKGAVARRVNCFMRNAE